MGSNPIPRTNNIVLEENLSFWFLMMVPAVEHSTNDDDLRATWFEGNH
jgi:hypothetical protein